MQQVLQNYILSKAANLQHFLGYERRMRIKAHISDNVQVTVIRAILLLPVGG